MGNVLSEEILEKYREVLNSYYDNETKKLKKLVNKVLTEKFGGIADKDTEEFYSVADEVFADIVKKDRYDSNKGDFEGFLYKALYFAFIDENNKQTRDKRCQKIIVEEINENGELVKKKIPIKNVYLDTPIGENGDSTIGDTVKSDFDINQKININCGEKVEKFLDDLPKFQRQIVEMLMEDIPVKEIKEKLGLSDNKYQDNLKSIKQNRMISIFNKNNKEIQCKKMEDIEVYTENGCDVDDVMELDTTDSYRTDKYPLSSLLDDKKLGYIDCTYISQRQPFQWNEEQINKFYSRILNNQPVPEIVICEQNIDGEKKSFLVEGLQRLTYSEEFKENRIPVTAKGAEFVNIKYKKRIINEDGTVRFVVDVFNIIGKYYKDLPEFLQKRFDKFNVSVTRFFNCTSKMIDYHIRNYNNHVAMNKSQYGITNVSNVTAKNIKSISEEHRFFKDNVKITNKNKKDGSWDEVVARTIMTMNFIDSWKKEVIDVLKFIDENATTEHFEYLKSNLNRLILVADKSVQDLFTTTNTHIWLAVFDKFTELNLEDTKFIEFMRAFKESLHIKEIDGQPFDVIYKDKGTRDKKVIVGKINGLVELMYEFLLVNKEDIEEVDVLDFVKENINPKISEEDVQFYSELLDDLTLDVDNDTRLLDKHNRPSLIALVGYACENDIDLDDWIKFYFKTNDKYILNQQENFLHMKQSFGEYLQKEKVA